MTKRKDRGPLLSSLVLVGLATAATGLLVLVGVRGSIPTLQTGNEDHTGPDAPGDVVVNDRPRPSPTPTPVSIPSRTRSATVRSVEVPVRSTTAPVVRPVATSAAPRPTSAAPSPKPATVASPTARPQPASPAPTPSSSCAQRDRTGRCRSTSSPAPQP